jgi:hypothetical protein
MNLNIKFEEDKFDKEELFYDEIKSIPISFNIKRNFRKIFKNSKKLYSKCFKKFLNL